MSQTCIALVLAAGLSAPVAEPAPAPPATTPVAPVAVAPAPRPVDPDLARPQRVAESYVIAGAIPLSLGAAALLLVTLPAHIRYSRSIERAEESRWVTERAQHVEDAQHHRTTMVTWAIVGTGLATAGAILLAVGLQRRARLRNPGAAALAVSPAVGGGHYGLGASLRF